MATGKIVQVIGAVVDVEFPQDAVPRVYEALEVQNGNEVLVLEVQQQLGGGIVRTIAMGSSDGLRRGLDVKDLEHPIEVPVGKATLGRIMNVLGQPVDMKGDIGEEERWAIHRAAPSYEELSSSQELLETGIKVIDLNTPRRTRWTSAVSVWRTVDALASCRAGGARLRAPGWRRC